MSGEKNEYESNRIDILKRIHSVTVEAVKTIGDISQQTNADIFLVICMGRLINLLDAMIVLLSAGLVYETQIIARTVFELICHGIITYKDPNFLDEIENHDLVMEKRSIELWLGSKPHLLDPAMSNETRAQEEQKLKELKEKINERKAKLIPRESLTARSDQGFLYATFYNLCCDTSHISLKHIRSCVIFDKNYVPRSVFCGKNHHPNESDHIVRFTEMLTSDFLKKTATRFDLKIQKEVYKISEDLRKIPSPDPSCFIHYE